LDASHEGRKLTRAVLSLRIGGSTSGSIRATMSGVDCQ
jgi:hypothetical protein